MAVHVLGDQRVYIVPSCGHLTKWAVTGDPDNPFRGAPEDMLAISTYTLCGNNHTYNIEVTGSDVLIMSVDKYLKLLRKDPDAVCKSCKRSLKVKFEVDDIDNLSDEEIGFLLLRSLA